MSGGRRIAVGAGLVAGAVLLAVVDGIAGGKYPVALTLLGIGGAALLIGLSVAVPGTLLARPEGTRAGELGPDGDLQAEVEGGAGVPGGRPGNGSGDRPGADRGEGPAGGAPGDGEASDGEASNV